MNSLLTVLGVMMATSGALPASQTWEQAVTATSPVGFWRFNETAAPFASIGSAAVNLTMAAGSAVQQQRLYPSTGKKTSLGSTSSYMALSSTDSAALRIGGDLTVCVVFSMSTLPAAASTSILCAMAGTGETEAVNALYYVGVINDGGVYKVSLLHEAAGAANVTALVAFPFAANTAYVLTVRRDTVAKTYTVSINNDFSQTVGYSDNPVGGSTGRLWVGSDLGFAGSTANTLRGAFDELAIWNRRLSDAEVASLWNGALYGMDTQTDDFSSNTVANYTQSANVNGTWAVSGGTMTATAGTQSVLLLNGLYSNRVKAKLTRADDGGVVLRFIDNGNYYVAVVADDSSTNVVKNIVSLYRRVGGTFTQLGTSQPIAFARGTEHELEFIAIGSRLIVKFDGVEKIAVDDTSLPATGRAGIRHEGSANTTVFTEFSWRAVDPFFDSVVFLTHLDGTTIRDEIGHTITAFGGAGITTVDPKFGDGCTDFNGVLDSYFESTSSDFQIGASQSFTIEFWRKAGARTLQENYMECNGARGTNPTGRWQIYHANSSDAPTFWSSGTSNLLTMSLLFPRDGQYHHEAWSRNANTLRAFLDGAAAGSTTAGLELNQSNLRWGTFENPTPVDQTYDEIRITKGVSRYDAAFARPSIPFPNGAHA